MSDSYEVLLLLQQTQRHFKFINEDNDLTDADKKQLKEFYLQNFIAPEARKFLDKSLTEEVGDSKS